MNAEARFLIFLLLCSDCWAYEVETHGLMTNESFDASILGASNSTQAEVYLRLGFDRVNATDPFFQAGLATCETLSDDPKRNAYVDAQPAWLSGGAPDAANRKFRCVQEYEKASFPPQFRGLIDRGLGPTPALRLEAWTMRGAIREDRNRDIHYLEVPENLQPIQ